MDEAKLDRLMIAALSGGTPLDEDALLPIVLESCDHDEEREDAESEGLSYALTEHLTSRSLLSFDWESWGAPTSSSDSMLALTVQSHIYLCLPADLDGLHTFIVQAASSTAGGQAGVSVMVQTQLPRLFDDVWPPRLPTSTMNLAPGLLRGQAVEQAYRSVAEEPNVWQALLVDLAELALLRTSASRISEPPRSDQEIASDDRARTFDQWFALVYREREL